MPRGTSLYDQARLAGRLWTPAIHRGGALAFWLDAADLSTIVTGTGVSQWTDKGGCGRHATQATGSAQPTYSPTGFDGIRPGLSFNYSNSQYLNLPDMTGAGWTSAEYFYVGVKNIDTPPIDARCGPFVSIGTMSIDDAEPYSD